MGSEQWARWWDAHRKQRNTVEEQVPYGSLWTDGRAHRAETVKSIFSCMFILWVLHVRFLTATVAFMCMQGKLQRSQSWFQLGRVWTLTTDSSGMTGLCVCVCSRCLQLSQQEDMRMFVCLEGFQNTHRIYDDSLFHFTTNIIINHQIKSAFTLSSLNPKEFKGGGGE